VRSDQQCSHISAWSCQRSPLTCTVAITTLCICQFARGQRLGAGSKTDSEIKARSGYLRRAYLRPRMLFPRTYCKNELLSRSLRASNVATLHVDPLTGSVEHTNSDRVIDGWRSSMEIRDAHTTEQFCMTDAEARFLRRKEMVFAALAISMLVLSPRCLAAAPTPPTSVSVTSYGAFSDGTHAIQTTAAFKSAFSENPSAQIIVPPGAYAIDNSSGPLIIINFNGELRFQGQAQLVFNTPTQG